MKSASLAAPRRDQLMPLLRRAVQALRPAPLQGAEVAAGLLALALPLTRSWHALGLSGFGLVALAVLVVRSATVAPLARTGVACAVVGNAFVFWPLHTVATSVALWADAVGLLCFLALGGWAEAGGSSSADLRERVRADGVRLLLGAGVAAALVAATWLQAPSALWLVFAAMAAGIGALALARRPAG